MKEIGAIKKGWGGKVPVGIVYPNSYFVGMSNLAVHQLYKLFNNDPKIVAERIFLPQTGKPRSVESGKAPSDFNVLAFTFSFESDYLNIPDLLGKDIPLLKKDRNERHPLLIAGGPAVTMNPLALSEIFDLVVCGEVEVIIDELLVILREGRPKDLTGNGKRFLKDLDKFPTHSVIWTDETEFGHMHLVETSRGCPWRCKFCTTPVVYEPYRTRSKEVIMDSISVGLPHRKHVGLIGADILAQEGLEDILNELSEKEIKVSFSSIRANRITRELAEFLKRSGHKRITLGVEAGSERLRKLMDKDLTDRNIFNAVKHLTGVGITNLKLYFMLGLPGETDEDIRTIPKLIAEIRQMILTGRQLKTMSPHISVVVTPFVPKKGTPFECEKFAGAKVLKTKLRNLRVLIDKIPNTRFAGESAKKAEEEYRLSHATGSDLVEMIMRNNDV